MDSKPIFFIGVPRSGTTIIFDAFSVHENLAWFSNWFEVFPRIPLMALLSRLTCWHGFRGVKQAIHSSSTIRRYVPHASECYPVWEHLCGAKFLFDFLLNATAGERRKRVVIEFMSRVMFFHGKDRFAAKVTGPPRTNYLNTIFPEAIFVHIIRDGRAVVNSLMNVDFWKQKGGYNRPWWRNGLSDEDFAVLNKWGMSPQALAAVQWRRIIYVAREEAKQMPDNRYHEIRYEDFVDDPTGWMGKILEVCQLPASRNIEKHMESVVYTNMNFKYRRSITGRDVVMLNDIMGDLLVNLGYDVNER